MLECWRIDLERGVRTVASVASGGWAWCQLVPKTCLSLHVPVGGCLGTFFYKRKAENSGKLLLEDATFSLVGALR